MNGTNTNDRGTRCTAYFTKVRKLRLDKPVYWDHHRGGWRDVVSWIADELHADDGTRLVTAIEDELFEYSPHYSGPVEEPWVGFIHQVPYQFMQFPDLERLIRLDDWKRSIEHCRGIWTLTDYQKEFLWANDVPVPIAKVLYPSSPPTRFFSFEEFIRNPRKRVITIGMFLRNLQAIYDLPAPGYEKVLLRNEETETYIYKLGTIQNDSVTALDPVNDEDYDRLLADNIVFLNLYDAVAATTIIECIVRGTPILVNRVGAITEYLGMDYPMYYDSLEEATHKVTDYGTIERTAAYLQQIPIRECLTREYFLDSLQNSSIYRSLPVPRSQQRRFKTFDVSIVVCSYKRVYNMERLLSLLSEQDFDGNFEVIIWNNNIEASSEINEISERFRDLIEIKVIHSSENYYCQIRAAVANLVRSELIMICDDDVMPQPGYLSRFLNRYKEYGPDAVICARGHVFLPQQVNEEHPERVWMNFEQMRFFDEKEQDRRVHFMHADNCLIPKKLMKRAMQFEMENYEYTLIDDYWLSYILAAKLGIPIWKIQASEVIKFTECSDDESIALFHNPLVREQRINFYIHHIRHGWPAQSDEIANSIWRSAGKPQPGKQINGAPIEPSNMPRRRSRQEQLTVDILRYANSPPHLDNGIYLRLAVLLVRLQEFFVYEGPNSRARLLEDLNKLINSCKTLTSLSREVPDYLVEAERFLNYLATEPRVENCAWRDPSIVNQMKWNSNILWPEIRPYYRWLSSRLEGAGDIVELGGWPGGMTGYLLEGLSDNPRFENRHLHAFDTFVWRKWMKKYLMKEELQTHPNLGEMQEGDDYLDSYLNFYVSHRCLLKTHRCSINDGDDEDSHIGKLPPLNWDGDPIELLVIDHSHTYHSAKNLWAAFHRSFLPGKTIIAFGTYGSIRAEGIRSFIYDHRDQLKAIHKPASIAKSYLFTG